jgi:hypothetical protein
MKKLVLVLTVAAFAVAVQAADNKSAQEKPACCAKTKTVAEKGECPMAKGTCSQVAKNNDAGPAKKALLSPKAASRG